MKEIKKCIGVRSDGIVCTAEKYGGPHARNCPENIKGITIISQEKAEELEKKGIGRRINLFQEEKEKYLKEGEKNGLSRAVEAVEMKETPFLFNMVEVRQEEIAQGKLATFDSNVGWNAAREKIQKELKSIESLN